MSVLSDWISLAWVYLTLVFFTVAVIICLLHHVVEIVTCTRDKVARNTGFSRHS